MTNFQNHKTIILRRLQTAMSIEENIVTCAAVVFDKPFKFEESYFKHYQQKMQFSLTLKKFV